MRAIVTNGEGDSWEETRDRPEPSEGEVLVKIRAVGICGSDIGLIDGGGPPWKDLPVVPGHEVCAEVVKLGAGVDSPSVGDRVALHQFIYCGTCSACREGRYYQCDEIQEIGFSLDGGYREYAAVPAYTLTPIPDSVSDLEACQIDSAACTLHAMDRIDISVSDTAAVLGPGALGLFGVQLLRAKGVDDVILTGTRPERLEAGRELGANKTINVRETDPIEAIMEYTDGAGVEVCVEAAGAGDVVNTSLKVAANQGQVALTGVFDASREIDPDDIVLKELTVVGGVTAAHAVEDVIELFERGDLTVDGIVTHEFPLAEYEEALETVRNRRDGVVKAVLRP
ncbi:alcohol dehydrogenase catalytic domain-containing protein [Natronolimnobius sp. AArcel1]|uniref:zinc-dependent alcohol dehydrogenase n=1 Tax=Natronolimnobius sp. AArcel1 TaxID=1679093 RepID=UPI0013E9D373|nr:alcohol dehydrogenase catalytic domain-containing protein [Natronolimnobius sp. AArcel1]NGM70627.1 alcohol dehydrogenase catalytic domain-containing protein [Natronolimnobius sp. AArcel1]